MTSAKQQTQMCSGPTEILTLDGRSVDDAAAIVQRLALHDVRVVRAQAAG